MDNVQESIGRIEVAPDVLVTIAHYASLRVEGVAKMASIPADVARLFRRESRQSGILLNLSDDNKVKFDIYVIMSPHVNIMETSKRLQNGRCRSHRYHGWDFRRSSQRACGRCCLCSGRINRLIPDHCMTVCDL